MVKPSGSGLSKKKNDEDGSEGGGGLYFRGASQSLKFVSSGCTVLDCVLGGGWPLGRIANIVGDKSTGKTLLAIEACANFARAYPKGRVLYAESESAFDVEYARALGLPQRGLELRSDIETVEQVFKLLGEFVEQREKAGAPGLFVLDSLDALTDDAEMERAIGEGTYGTGKAKQMSQLFRRLVRKIEQSQVLVLIISQVRDNIGVTFGRKTTRSGGRALDFYASQVLYLAHLKTITRTVQKVKRAVGIEVRAKCDKNKIGLPLRECQFVLEFGYGIDDAATCRAWLEEVGRKPPADDTALPERVMRAWVEIEESFAPKRSKYGNSTEEE